MVGPSKHYRSFISYSQQDKVWGKRIHTWLETYRVPVGVIADIQPGRRLGRFFRDDEEMAAAADIASIVRGAIDTAESIIVICSPRSAQSTWVNAEINHFRHTGRAAKVFAVIIDGVPNSGDPATECFPPALRAAGDPDHPDALPIEPMGLDVRRDGKERTCARLAAGLLEVDFDDLWQRERRRAEFKQRRLVISLSAISLVFAALAGAATWLGLLARHNANEANRQKAVAEARTKETEGARDQLQREYLGMLGETAISEVLTRRENPGEIRETDAALWIPLMRRGEQDFAVARDFEGGRVLALAHDGVLTSGATPRGAGFLKRTMSWLTSPRGAATVVISSGHCEWQPNREPNWKLPVQLRQWGYSVRAAPGVIDSSVLDGAGVLIIGNAWGDFSDDERAAVERYVAQGGGLLAVGLGWSWVQYADRKGFACAGMNGGQVTTQLATYPMNRLLEPFGLRWTNSVIPK